MLSTLSLGVALGLVSFVSAQADPAQLALTEAQYEASGFAANTNTGFGVPLDAQALLQVQYGDLQITNGQDYTTDQVANLPTFTVLPARLNQYTDESDIEFTLMLADAASLGDADPEGNYRHYLANDLEVDRENDQTGAFRLDSGDVVTSYAGPGPLQGSGVHRYAWLLLQQPDQFRAPSGLASPTGPGHWNVSQYVSEANLRLVAASFFTVTAPGNPTGAVVETSAVDTATLQVSSAASSAASNSAAQPATSSARPTGSTNGPSSAAPAASQPASGAGKLVGSVAAALGALGLVALC